MATDPKKKETPSVKEQLEAIDKKLPRRMRRKKLIPTRGRTKLA